MQTNTLPDKEKNERMSYMNYMIHKFAESYKMNKPEGYSYLKQYGGLDYIREFWWPLHTDNQKYAVRSVFRVCKNNGGYL